MINIPYIIKSVMAILFVITLFSCEGNYSNVQKLQQADNLPFAEGKGVNMKYTDSGVVVANLKAPELLDYGNKEFPYKEFPKGGYDFCLFDRCVAEKVLKTKDRNSELAILLLSFGFKYKLISYTREKRQLGKSGWTLSKKIKLFIDTFTSNSYVPLRMVSSIGAISAFLSFVYFLVIFILWSIGNTEVEGWTTLVLLITFYSGLILLSIGIIGEYIWRILDGVKNNERYIIEKKVGFGGG